MGRMQSPEVLSSRTRRLGNKYRYWYSWRVGGQPDARDTGRLSTSKTSHLIDLTLSWVRCRSTCTMRSGGSLMHNGAWGSNEKQRQEECKEYKPNKNEREISMKRVKKRMVTSSRLFDLLTRLAPRKILGAFRPAFVAAIVSGLRPSDVFSLKWADVNLNDSCSNVARYVGPRRKSVKTLVNHGARTGW